MISPEAIDIDSLPSIPLANRKHFPEEICIYIAIDSLGTVQYVGQTKNLRQRWNTHHRYQELSRIDGVRIAYISVATDLLQSVEAALIEWFQPALNGERVVTGLRGRKQLSASIPSKLFERLEELANHEGRSVSNLASYLLERSIDERYRLHGRPVQSKEDASDGV